MQFIHNYLCMYECMGMNIPMCVCVYFIFLYELIRNIKVELNNWQTLNTKMLINYDVNGVK